MSHSWNDSSFKKSIIQKGMDGLEEWGLVEWRPKAYADAPKLHGIMAGSLGVERDDAKKVIYVGGGGEAKDYILKQELDRSLHHTVGKAGFIKDNVKEKSPTIAQFVQKHINK